jgi:lipopolysaccharide export system protein LptA
VAFTRFFLIILSVSSLTALSFPLLGLSTDFEQPIEIEADFAELDDQEGTTVYIGNVVLVQGSIVMTGDKLIATFTSERDLEKAILEGRLATFRQTPDKGQDIEGEGAIIEMHAFDNMFFLTGKAKVTQGLRLTQGHRISYDTEKSISTVRTSRSSNSSANTSDRPKDRVRIVIPPKEKEIGKN